MSDAPKVNLQTIQNRATLLKGLRQWFEIYPAIELDTPTLSLYGNPDLNIEPFFSKGSTLQGYLHTSPEFAMKQFIAAEKMDCYQICKVYRDGEIGRNHQPEFTMLEWYRMGWDENRLMDEVARMIQKQAENFAIELSVNKSSYFELFMEFCGFDPHRASINDCVDFCQQQGIDYPQSWLAGNELDAMLDLILSIYIAPQFEPDALQFVYHYPPSQASLARKVLQPYGEVAARFELYWGQLELANGFNELTDASEQRQRFVAENNQRQQVGLDQVPLDEEFLNALEQGMPDCSGVALGIDRLLMKLCKVDSINQVIFLPHPQ